MSRSSSGLRVIAGKAKGRILSSVPGEGTRPITDRAKESLFNILRPDMPGSVWLDLFAGTGSVGIEALSRDASFVRFIDLSRSAVETVQSNLALTGFTKDAEVIKGDAFSLLHRTPDRKFDYVYVAPPQYHDLWKRALLLLDEKPGWMVDDAWVIAQIHPTEYEELELENLEEFDQRKYGSTLLVFFERVPPEGMPEQPPD